MQLTKSTTEPKVSKKGNIVQQYPKSLSFYASVQVKTFAKRFV